MTPLAQNEELSDPLVTFDSAWAIVARSHWDTTYNGVNWTAVGDSLRPAAAVAKTRTQLRMVLSAMIGTLHQSHFSIIPAAFSDAASGTRVDGAAPGNKGSIGATFRDIDDQLVLTGVSDHGSARRAGLRAGYVVEAVNGCKVGPRFALAASSLDARRTPLNRWRLAHSMLSGAVNDSLRVDARDGEGHLHSQFLMLEPEPGTVTQFGNLPPIAANLEWETTAVGARSVGIIRFNAWMPVLSIALNAAVDSLRGSDAIVLDVRGNFGGLIAMSTGVAGHFVDSTLTLGTMIQRGSVQTYVINPQRIDGKQHRVTPFGGPLALVVDELSISTTEIFAAGMQGLGRARVFGIQTAGQSLPSVAERLPDGDVLYHAVGNFLSPSGRAIEGIGVTPDLVVPVTRRALLRGADPALDAAVQWAASATKVATRKPHESRR